MAAAAAGSALELPLFYGLGFSFGLVPVLLALVWLGLPAGLSVAAVQASVTALLSGHPYAFPLVASQVIFVSAWLSWARHRAQGAPIMPLALGVYWLLLGTPLTLLYGLFWLDFALAPTLTLLLQQAVNDLIAALLAEILLLVITVTQRRQASLSNRRVLFVLFTATTLLPAFTLTFIGMHALQQHFEQALLKELRLFSDLATETALAAPPQGVTPTPHGMAQYQERLQRLLQQSLSGNSDPRVRLLPTPTSAVPLPADMADPHAQTLMRLDNVAVHARPDSPLDWSQMRYHLSLPLADTAAFDAIAIELDAQVIIAPLNAALRLWLSLLLGWAVLALFAAYWLSRLLAAPLASMIEMAHSLPGLVDSGQPMPALPRSRIKEKLAAARAMIALGERLQASFNALAEERDRQREQRALRTLQAETLSELIAAEHPDTQPIADGLCQRIVRLLPGYQCSLAVANTRDILQILAAPSFSDKQIDLLNTRLAERPGACARQQGDCAYYQLVAASSATNDGPHEPAPDAPSEGQEQQSEQPGPCWCQPIRDRNDRVLGMLTLSAARPTMPDRFARELLEHGASLAAVVLTNLQLRRDHQTLLEALSQAETGIVISEHGHDGDDPIRFVSKGFESLTGYSADDVRGQDCRLLQGTDREQPERELIRTALTEGRGCQVTLRNYRKDGSLFWNSVSITPVRDAGGRITHFIGVQRDDTERRQALDRLSASEAQLREITETIEEAFWVQEIGQDCLSYISRAFETIWERPIEALQTSTDAWRESLHPDDRERVLRAQLEVPTDGSLNALEYRILTPSGRLKWIADRRFLSRDASGRARRVIGVAAEITDRKQAELALSEQQQRLEQIIEGARIGTWDWRLDNDSVHCNERWAQMLGYRLDEVPPVSLETWRQMVHPEDLPEAEQRLQAHLDGQQPLFEHELRMRHRDGHWIWVLTTGRTVERDATGQPRRIIGIHLEITKRKQAELDLIARERLERELVELTTTFVDLTGQPFDEVIQAALEKTGRLTGSDRAYLFQTNRRGKTVSNTHEWVAPGIASMRATLQAIPVDDMEGVLRALEESDMLTVPAVSELPDDWSLLRNELERQQIQSLILVPLLDRQRLRGFVGLGAVRQRRNWTGPEVQFLRVLAGTLLGALQREQVLAELRASTERYDALAQQSRMMTWEIDINGIYTYVNPVSETLLGYPPEALIGRRAFYELIPEPERTSVKARAIALMEQHAPCREFVCPMLGASGRRLWTSADAMPIFSEDGRLIGYRGSTLDITDVQQADSERRAAEQALQLYAQNLERLVELSNRGLEPAAETTELLAIANDALAMAGAETGWCGPQEPYRRLACASEYDCPAEPSVQQAVKTLFANPQQTSDRPQLISGHSLPAPLRDCGYRSAIILASRYHADPDQPRWLVTQLWSGHARAALSDAERELLRFIGQRIVAIEYEAQLARDLVNAKERETIGHLASGVAHDFNNVLAVLDANLFFLRGFIDPADAEDDDSVQVIDEMNSALGQAKVITSGMLALSRAGGVPLRPTQLEPPLTELANILRMMLPESISWQLEIEPGLSASTNAGFLQAALLNLALNGRDAMPRGGRLQVSAQRESWNGEPPLAVGELERGDYAAIRVTDNGTGMPEAVLNRIFEPLFSTKARQRGHGLGMFMVREFVVRSGAGLTVHSTVGVGTRFQFLLPLPSPQTASDAQTARAD